MSQKIGVPEEQEQLEQLIKCDEKSSALCMKEGDGNGSTEKEKERKVVG